MHSLSETRALQARVFVARGLTDPADAGGFLEPSVEMLPRTRRGRALFLPFRNLKELHR